MYHFFMATPEKILFDDFIRSINVPGTVGYFEVLQNHAPLISTLKEGNIIITDKNLNKSLWTISRGLIEVLKNKVVLLGNSIELKTESFQQS